MAQQTLSIESIFEQSVITDTGNGVRVEPMGIGIARSDIAHSGDRFAFVSANKEKALQDLKTQVDTAFENGTLRVLVSAEPKILHPELPGRTTEYRNEWLKVARDGKQGQYVFNAPDDMFVNGTPALAAA